MIVINLNTTAWDEHVPEIERYIQTIKEKIRATTNTLPFKQLPHWLIVEFAYNAVFWLNCFPHKDGIHNTLSQRAIVTRSKIDFNKHSKLQFGTYIQMHKQHNNSLLPRMAGAIALRPTGNEQGSYYFLSLHTGKRVVRNNWTVLPMPLEVIATVHQLAVTCKKYKGITFTDKDGNIIRDNKDDEDDIVGNSNDGTVGNSEITGVHGNSNELQTTTGIPELNIEGNSPEDEVNADFTEGNSPEDKGNADYTEGNMDSIGNSTENEGNSNHDEDNTNDHEGNGQGNTYNNGDSPSNNNVEYGNTCNMDDDEISIENGSMEDPQITINDISIIEEMNTAQINNNETNEEPIENNREWTKVAKNNRYNLRSRPANRGNMYTILQNGPQLATVSIPKPHAHVMLTQINIREGIKRFGKKESEALLKELNQLYQREALLPVSREDMSYDKKKKVLQFLMFLKEKRDSSIKARGCADGRS